MFSILRGAVRMASFTEGVWCIGIWDFIWYNRRNDGVHIVKELLPTAHKFDKTNGILSTTFIIIGMVVMALSLVLFAY